MSSGFKEYWNTWLWRDATTRIITVNVIAWLVIAAGLLYVPMQAHGWWISIFALPASIFELPSRIWTVATYMISQSDFMHLLVNMLWLLLFGRIVAHAMDDKRLIAIYVIGGLAGAAAFIVANLILPGSYPFMLGASCSVIAVVGASMMVGPRWQVNLLFFGFVKVIWVALAAIVLFVVIEPNGYVQIAHAAGLIAGILYALAAGYKPTGFSMPKRAAKPEEMNQQQINAEIDAILDKARQSGYASLSAADRQRLFDLSQKNKK